MALLADLRDFQYGFTHAQPRADGQRLERDPAREDVLGKITGMQLQPRRAHRVHAFFRQQTHLPVPVACVRVAHNAVAASERDLRHGMLALPFFFADADGDDFHHIFPSRQNVPLLPPVLQIRRMSEISISRCSALHIS